MNILFPSYSMGIFSFIILVMTLPVISLIIRRLHDCERNGSWILLVLAPLFLAIVAWTYSIFFFSADKQEKEVSIMSSYQDESMDIHVTENGDTIIYWPSARMQAEESGGIFEGTYNNNPIMIDPSVFHNEARNERIVYGTAGIVSFLFFFWLVGMIILTVLCTVRGTEGPNRYGPDPNVN